jgi:hypothetical protein
MKRRRFFFPLGIVTVIMTGLVLALQFFPVFQNSLYFSIFNIAFFVMLSIGSFFLGVKTALSKDKNAFTRFIMVFTFVKLLLCVVLVVSYHRIFQPQQNFFLIPFFLTYLTYTILETVYLSKLGKIKAR